MSDVERFTTLEVKLSNLTALLSDIARQMTDVQMLAQNITRIQERQDRHNEGLDRAFKAIEKTKADLVDAKYTSDTDREAIKSVMNRWAGGLSVLMLVSVGVQSAWWRSEDNKAAQISRIERITLENERRITIIEARSAGYRIATPPAPDGGRP